MDKKQLRKGFVSTETTERLIKEIMFIRGSNSRSHIIRDAIFEYRKNTKGFYTDETAAGKIKALKLKEMEAQAEITPNQLAKDLKAPSVTSPDGLIFFRIRGNGNVDRCIPYDSFKEVVSNDDWLISEHKKFIAAGGVIPAEFTSEIWPK